MSVVEARTKWQPVETEGADQLFVEVVMVGGREEVGLLDSVPIERVMSVVTEVARSVGQSLERAGPSKASVEVGIEFGLQEGRLVGLIARGSGKANLKIAMEWERGRKAE